MGQLAPNRPERSLESFSRGAELVRAIRTLTDGSQDALKAEFDLTDEEWTYWVRLMTPKEI